MSPASMSPAARRSAEGRAAALKGSPTCFVSGLHAQDKGKPRVLAEKVHLARGDVVHRAVHLHLAALHFL
eukprot:CAMPEP_0176087154 /NCGR_PEP_ID=MMETSP0120_2-20121206/43630_1 /TAXON_ID=160619 /ORGANISM="Kryptoperidinium foliaceum, Strain CCMP 1326" /LENGTH=69 /DNA_ID=CAMNT_0017420993 /DNA_START=115 /DNA_END=322 /DNA_ORIENTATION=+